MLYILIKLYVRPGALEAFREYERKALEIFRRHGGELIVAFSPESGTEGADGPDEIHVLKIATRSQFENFLADPDRRSLAALRDTVLRASETILSRELIRY